MKQRLTEGKLAFYDALETNNIPLVVLGDGTVVKIASELVDTVRKNAAFPAAAF